MYANIWMIWGWFKSNSDVTSPDSSTQTSKISKLHSSTHVHQRPVSKIPKNDVCKFQTESEVIIFTNPTPPVFWRANLPKSLYICLVLIPQKMGNFMTHAKKKSSATNIQEVRQPSDHTAEYLWLPQAPKIHSCPPHRSLQRPYTHTLRMAWEARHGNQGDVKLCVCCVLFFWMHGWYYWSDNLFSEGPQRKSFWTHQVTT